MESIPDRRFELPPPQQTRRLGLATLWYTRVQLVYLLEIRNTGIHPLLGYRRTGSRQGIDSTP
jgi:hypothetical protein